MDHTHRQRRIKLQIKADRLYSRLGPNEWMNEFISHTSGYEDSRIAEMANVMIIIILFQWLSPLTKVIVSRRLLVLNSLVYVTVLFGSYSRKSRCLKLVDVITRSKFIPTGVFRDQSVMRLTLTKITIVGTGQPHNYRQNTTNHI